MRRSRRTLAVRHRDGLLERRLRVDQLALPGERPRAERMRLDLRGVVDAAAADTELLRLLRQRVGAADRGGADERHPCGGGGSLLLALLLLCSGCGCSSCSFDFSVCPASA